MIEKEKLGKYEFQKSARLKKVWAIAYIGNDQYISVIGSLNNLNALPVAGNKIDEATALKLIEEKKEQGYIHEHQKIFNTKNYYESILNYKEEAEEETIKI